MTRDQFEMLVAFVEAQHEQIETMSDPATLAQMKAIGMDPPTAEQLKAATETVEVLERTVALLYEVWNGKKVVLKGVSSFAKIEKSTARLDIEDA